jgi:Nucleotidyltransferase domain
MDLGEPYSAVCPTLDGPVLDVLGHTNLPLTGREIARLARRGSERGVRLVLDRLVDYGLVTAQRAGPSWLFALNRDHVAAAAVASLLRLRAELFERIARDIETWPLQPIHASIFGSAARGDGTIRSDIDVLILRPADVVEDDAAWREQVHALAERIHRWSGNHASLAELSPEQLRLAVRREDAFLESVRETAIRLVGPELADVLASRRTPGAA